LVDGDPAGDDYVERFACAVEDVLLDRAGAQRRAASARQRVRSEFSIDAACRRYREILASVCR
jgi:glycosyltransferase involved in cell wall biosynthesis